MNPTVTDRRSFIQGAGLASAAGVIGLGASGAFAAEEAAWDGEYDVIVAGAGLAGLASAITVATEGDGATCLLLEKCAYPNGNTPYSGGGVLWSDDVERDRVYLKELMGGQTPDDVVDAYVEELGKNADWVRELGAEESWVQAYPSEVGLACEYPEFYGNPYNPMLVVDPEGNGPAHVFNFMFDLMESRSDVITYMPETPIEELVQDPATKEILGVVAGGKRYKADKGVIMCTGGFENNPEMMYCYTGVEGAVPHAAVGNTGDGHKICMAVGADLWHMSGGAMFWNAPRNLENTEFLATPPVYTFTTKQHGITVGVHGRRYYQDYDGCMLFPEDNGYSHATNISYHHGITQFGGEMTHLPLPSKSWFIFDADGLAAGAIPEGRCEDPVADGWALVADTIEELAEQLAIPGEELAATVEQYNKFCAEGKDAAFYRPPTSMSPIQTPPFYAMLCVPALLNTDGGPKRDAKGRIISVTGEPIPHLYSSGEFGSIWGHLYNGCGNLGECFAFGRISARSALAGE